MPGRNKWLIKVSKWLFLWPALVKVEFQDPNLYKTILEDEKKSFLHLIWMITFLEFDYTIPIKVSILRLKDRRKQQSSLWPITKTLKYDYYHLASVSRGFWGLIRVISYHNPWFTYLKYRNVWLLQLQKFQYILAFITLHKYNLPREDTVAAGSL